ncbi:hypothetical protein [Lacinutrix sp. Bg11-31]|uniref:hypothetical protein n=1 Tax=Lacinutrix sp. Bg11-31 TaxID=2057808 RepID=UPI000C30F93C|nr:hypothetical protein [Lacinutrix sp. Bg11-31]AUC81313.1 hypothetical protein CW733_03855 [Lacinutrix sp. Bg11-31]
MKNVLIILAILLFTTSCFPVKIAPNIETHKITTAKKFKRKLPKEASFIFNDPKNAGEFYDYLNAKYNLDHVNVGANTPFNIGNETYYLSYREAERETKTINLALAAIDAKRESNGNSRLFEDDYSKRVGIWYILLTVYDDDFNNCLKPEYTNNKKVVLYLEAIRKEYLRTQNYLELQFKKKS